MKISKHEEKNCPRCNMLFECKPGDITHCQCYGIKFTGEERQYIAAKFTDCLCAACMVSLRSEYNIAQRALQLKIFIAGR